MFPFAQSLLKHAGPVEPYLPLLIGVVVSVLVFTLFSGTSRRSRQPRHHQMSVSSGVPENAALNWTPAHSFADRRNSVRRDGQVVPIEVCAPALRRGSTHGVVLDRSIGGLRIVINSAVQAGSRLQVRAANAPDTVGYVTVVVRNCRKSDFGYEAGCEFEQTPPWNVLLLFG